MSQRYYGLSEYFKKVYGEKLVKLSIDGGFTCPNRDGTLSKEGCIFCSDSGSGEFSGVIELGEKLENSEISKQIESQKSLLASKWQSKSYIAYFQNYTNTYKPIVELERIYKEALNCEGVMGIAIATRPDCILESHCELFKKSKVMWVELGLQTIHDEKSAWMRRHYDYEDFVNAYNLLQKAEIPVVVHLIVGLPNETKEEFLRSVRAVSALKPFGIKFHMLNVLKGTDLEILFNTTPFELLSEIEYIEWVCDAIECLDPEIVIHRLTGDGEKSMVIAPKWILNKRSVLNGINKCLVKRNSRQGVRF